MSALKSACTEISLGFCVDESKYLLDMFRFCRFTDRICKRQAVGQHAKLHKLIRVFPREGNFHAGPPVFHGIERWSHNAHAFFFTGITISQFILSTVYAEFFAVVQFSRYFAVCMNPRKLKSRNIFVFLCAWTRNCKCY